MGRVSSINAIFHIMVGWVALRVFTYAVVYMGTAFCHSFFCSALCESRVTWRLPYFMCHTLFTDMCIFYCAVSYFFLLSGEFFLNIYTYIHSTRGMIEGAMILCIPVCFVLAGTI
uniref:Uncharacterized protein n=1 Tax=Rhipicephalus microplus TaxID=6941 RepID=A0A6G5AHV6_RHIMP